MKLELITQQSLFLNCVKRFIHIAIISNDHYISTKEKSVITLEVFSVLKTDCEINQPLLSTPKPNRILPRVKNILIYFRPYFAHFTGEIFKVESTSKGLSE